MESMTVTHPLPHERGDLVVRDGPFTIADRDALPADGRRHELLDGVLVMSPSPRASHQVVAARLFSLLEDHRPLDHLVLFAPVDVRLSTGDRTALQPDLVVLRAADLDPEGFTTRPLLCVEVASPSTRLFDLGCKKELYADVGCPTYWTIEPTRGPELTVWTLIDGVYLKERVVTGAESWTASTPFPVSVVPMKLLDARFRD